MIDLGEVGSKMVVLFDSPTDVYRSYFLEEVDRLGKREEDEAKENLEKEEMEEDSLTAEECDELTEMMLENAPQELAFDPYMRGSKPDLDGIAEEGQDLFLADQILTKWKIHNIDLYYAVVGTLAIDWFESYFDDKEDILCSLLMDEENNVYNFEKILQEYPNLRYMLFINTFERDANNFDRKEVIAQRKQVIDEGFQDVYDRYLLDPKIEALSLRCNIENLLESGARSTIGLHFQDFIYQRAVNLEEVDFHKLPFDLIGEIKRYADTSYPMDTILEVLLEDYYFYTKGLSYLLDGDIHEMDQILLGKIEYSLDETVVYLCQDPSWLYPLATGYMHSVVSYYLPSQENNKAPNYEELMRVENKHQFMKKFSRQRRFNTDN